MKKYDSADDTNKHQEKVCEFINRVIEQLVLRMIAHDETKLLDAEKKFFDKYTPKLKKSTYGSDEYNENLKGLAPALEHHYKHNRHHPEHFSDGINGMDMIDILEMLCDWKAATLRHADGDIHKSLEINSKRFKIDPQLLQIMKNTVENMKW